MKFLFILLLLMACRNAPIKDKKPTYEIPINTRVKIDVTKKANYNIQKSPSEQHVFKMVARGDSLIVENQSK